MTIRTKKKIIITILLVIITGLGFAIFQLYEDTVQLDSSNADHCISRADGSDICITAGYPESNSNQTIDLPVKLYSSFGEVLEISLPVNSITTDQQFTLSNGSTVIIQGSKAIKMSRPKQQNTTGQQPDIVAGNFNLLGAPTSIIDPLAQPGSSGGSAVSGSSVSGTSSNQSPIDEIVIVPIAQYGGPDGSVNSQTSNPNDEASNSIAFYDEVNGQYVEIDLSWLGYFTLTEYEIRSYNPPEVRVVGTRAGAPFETILMLDQNNQIRTLFSTDSQVQAYN